MIDLIRSLLREPILTGIVFACVALVVGLILSDRAEKRRTRELLQAREAARLAMLQRKSGEVAAPIAIQKPGFRIFRWEFVVLSMLVIAFVYPSMTDKEDVTAKESSKQPATAAEADAAQLAGAAVATKVNFAGARAHTNTAAGGDAAINPNALFQFDTRSDLGELDHNVFAPSAGGGLDLPHESRTRFNRK